MIAGGLFVRFGEVFEGFLPARRLPGGFHKLNELGTALGKYRLGDPLGVRVEEVRRWEGKVELSLAEGRSH